MFGGEFSMKTTLIKIMIGLLPTAFSADAVDFDLPQDENNDDSTSIESIIEEYNNNYQMIYNIDETNVKIGDDFDPLAVVYSVDSTDDLTSNIEVDSDIDTDTEGQYVLTYKVTNSDGAWYENNRLVTVSQNEST